MNRKFIVNKMILETKKKAFTLIELLVSIFLILLLSSLTVANYNQIRANSLLDQDFELVVDTIRYTQSSALAPFKGISAGIGADEKLCGIGVHFVDGSSLVTTYYVAEDDCSTVANYAYNNINTLDQYQLRYSVVRMSESEKDLFFETPFAKAYTYPSSWINNSVSIESIVDNSLDRTLQMNEGGLLLRD